MRMRSCVINMVFVVTISVLTLETNALGTEAIKFALPGNSMGYLPLFVAVHRGFFKDEGLDIELPRLIPRWRKTRCSPAKFIITALLIPVAPGRARFAFESDLLRCRQANVLSGGAKRDSLGRRAARQANRRQPIRRHLRFRCASRAQALRRRAGKRRATHSNRRRGHAHGRAPRRIRSAIIVPVPAVAVLRREGYNEVSFVGDVVEFASNGYSTTDQRIKEHPQEVKKVVQSALSGSALRQRKPRGDIGVIQREWKVDPRSPRNPIAQSSKRSTKTAS